MNRRAATSFVPLALTLALTGCTQSSQGDGDVPPLGGLVCTEEFRAGLVVEVRDAWTGLPAANDAIGEITDGAYKEVLLLEGGMTAPPDPALQLVGAWERPGVYEVTVQKAGYLPWSASAVTVTADTCHVETVRIEAALEPMP